MVCELEEWKCRTTLFLHSFSFWTKHAILVFWFLLFYFIFKFLYYSPQVNRCDLNRGCKFWRKERYNDLEEDYLFFFFDLHVVVVVLLYDHYLWCCVNFLKILFKYISKYRLNPYKLSSPKLSQRDPYTCLPYENIFKFYFLNFLLI